MPRRAPGETDLPAGFRLCRTRTTCRRCRATCGRGSACAARRWRSPPPAPPARGPMMEAAALIAAGRRGCGGGGRRGQPLPADAARLRLARAAQPRALPPLRRRPRRHLHRRGGRPGAAGTAGGGARGRAAAARRRAPAATGTTCPPRIRRGSARSAPCARRWRRPGSTPARSTTSTCTAPARAPTTPWRTAPSTTSSAMRVPCSSTKGWTGHTLGASGAIEAMIAAICVEDGLVPGCLGVDGAGPGVPRRCRGRATAPRAVRRVLSNSFGFGGSNCAPGDRPRRMRAWIGGDRRARPRPAGLGGERGHPGRRPRPGTMAEAVAPAARHPAPTERRRRAGATVRFALAAATEATAEPSRTAPRSRPSSPAATATARWWAASWMRCTTPDGAVSPTQFHNSVHNAAAGYWHIAVGSTRPRSAWAGMTAPSRQGCWRRSARSRRAAARCCSAPTTRRCRRRWPPCGRRPSPSPPRWCCARRRVRARGRRWSCATSPRPRRRPPPADALDALAAGNPAARALPLLRALAARRAALLRLPLLGRLRISRCRVAPC